MPGPPCPPEIAECSHFLILTDVWSEGAHGGLIAKVLPLRALDMGGLVSGAKERVGACPVLVFLALRAWAWRRDFRGI